MIFKDFKIHDQQCSRFPGEVIENFLQLCRSATYSPGKTSWSFSTNSAGDQLCPCVRLPCVNVLMRRRNSGLHLNVTPMQQLIELPCIWSSIKQRPLSSFNFLASVSRLIFQWMQLIMCTATLKFPFLATMDYGNWAGNPTHPQLQRPLVKCPNNKLLTIAQSGLHKSSEVPAASGLLSW
jgi:hypothetical protein